MIDAICTKSIVWFDFKSSFCAYSQYNNLALCFMNIFNINPANLVHDGMFYSNTWLFSLDFFLWNFVLIRNFNRFLPFLVFFCYFSRSKCIGLLCTSPLWLYSRADFCWSGSTLDIENFPHKHSPYHHIKYTLHQLDFPRYSCNNLLLQLSNPVFTAKDWPIRFFRQYHNDFHRRGERLTSFLLGNSTVYNCNALTPIFAPHKPKCISSCNDCICPE